MHVRVHACMHACTSRPCYVRQELCVHVYRQVRKELFLHVYIDKGLFEAHEMYIGKERIAAHFAHVYIGKELIEAHFLQSPPFLAIVFFCFDYDGFYLLEELFEELFARVVFEHFL